MKLYRSFWLAGATALVIGLARAAVVPRSSSSTDSAATAKRSESAYVPVKQGVTFNKEIAPIVFHNCSSCHRPGEVAPFSLLQYSDVKKRARQIAMVTESRYMPPWHADPGYGDMIQHRNLSDEQIGLIKSWVAAGAPEGNAKDLPPLPKFARGWQLGEPDAILAPKEEYSLGADGKDVYQCFVIPTDYEDDRYVSMMEVRPGNRAVVHHVIAFLDTTGTARKLDEAAPGPGYTSFGGTGFLPSGTLGGWAPGNLPRPLPSGTGILLPKGADIVLQVHYYRSGKPETDRTRIGLHFAKTPIEKRVRVLSVINPRIRIPAGESNHVIRASHTLSKDVTAYSVMPHMHLLGKEMTVLATLPDGTEKRLLRVRDWDFNWQTSYAFKEPLKLPKGTRIDVEAHYDNSAENPRNPSQPPRLVTWGEKTTDEMCIAFLPYSVDEEQLTRGAEVESLPGDFGDIGQRPWIRLLIRRFDKNGDGILNDEERAELMKFREQFRTGR